ncbi:MAG: RluA family pseudouridine synthase [Xanthomonadales bacterium]|nr:RluA family pseudouridine synthase [Xanthomonadales bacterium]
MAGILYQSDTWRGNVKSPPNRRAAGSEHGRHEAAGGAGERTGVVIHEVDAGQDGQRLDNFLLGRLKGAPRSLVYRLLRTGQVRVNGGRARPDTRLAIGDRVRLPPVRIAPAGEAAPVPAAMRDRLLAAVIHEDRDLLVLDKPAGIACHGGSGVSLGVIEALRAQRGDAYLELVHRLDRDTSGILVLARSRKALLALQAQLRSGGAQKRYLALLAGRLQPSPFRIEAPLRKHVLQGGERMVQVAADGKPSVSTFTVAQRLPGATLAEVLIETGRTHQIRVHARHIGHPVAGDEKYGDAEFNARMRAIGLRRLFLHAASLRIRGPAGEDLLFHAELPVDLRQALDALERH